MRVIPITILFAVAVFMLPSCSPTEELRNSFDDTWRLVASGPNGVAARSMPDGIVSNPSVWTPSPLTNYPAGIIREYRDLLFVVSNIDATIIVLHRDTLNVVDTIRTDAVGKINDIAFANATTAYATTDSFGVAVIDLISNTVVTTIPFTEPLFGIAIAGNQMMVSMPNSNRVALLDTRTNAVTVTLDVPTSSPTFVAADGLNNIFAVVCMGNGKFPGDTRPLSTPTISFVDIAKRTVVKTLDLTSRASEGPTQIPKGLAINSTENAFIPVQSGLLRVNTRSQLKVSAIQFDSYSAVYYNAARSELNTVSPDGKTLTVFDEFGEQLKSTVVISDSIYNFVGVSR